MSQKTRSPRSSKRVRTAAFVELPALKEAPARSQLGVRIAEDMHRQLKLAAVVCGETVQTLVEQAIREFLTNHPELQHIREPKSRRAR